MGEVSLRAVADVTLDRDPFTAFIANFLARGADGQNAGEGFDLGQGIGQFRDQVLAFGLRADRSVSSRSMLSTTFRPSRSMSAELARMFISVPSLRMWTVS